MLLQIFRLNWKQIPTQVKSFLMNALAIFAVWSLLYHFYLQPNRLLDDVLTRFTGLATEWVLGLIYGSKAFHAAFQVSNSIDQGISSVIGSSLVWMGEQPLISIFDPCNGLNMYALFLGFIIAFPSSVILKLSFGSAGLLALIGVNVARCVGLAVLQIHYPNFTVFAHHYVFNVLTYAAVFGLWYWFTKKTGR